MGRSCTTKVIFGDKDLIVLEVYTLEGLGLEVNPVSGRLKEATPYLL